MGEFNNSKMKIKPKEMQVILKVIMFNSLLWSFHPINSEVMPHMNVQATSEALKPNIKNAKANFERISIHPPLQDPLCNFSRCSVTESIDIKTMKRERKKPWKTPIHRQARKEEKRI